MVEFVKEGDKFLCTNGHGSVFGEIFMLEDGLYYYSDNHNIGGCYTWHTLKCIQEKLLELNSFKKQKYGFNDHMEPKQHVKPIKIKETQDLVVNFLDEENGDIVCKNDNGITIGVILKSPLLGNYVYFILNENINIETQKIIEDKTNKLNEENKDEISKNISNELEKMQNARLNKSSNDKDEEREEDYRGMLRVMQVFYRDNIVKGDRDNNCKDELKTWAFRQKKQDIKEVLNQRQKTHGEFSQVSKTYSDFIKTLENTGFFGKCEDHHRLAIDVIFLNLSRILNGDMNFDDRWLDIIEYSELVLKQLDKNKKQD